MNEKNYDYLKNQVKFTGFGEDLNERLAEQLEKQDQKFSLPHQATFGKDEVSSMLHFEKSKESDMYFFQNFDMSLKDPSGNDLKQTYYIGQVNNMTLKEHYNMVQGRSVHKVFNKLEQIGEGENIRFRPTKETYKAWADLNFKETDGLGNFEMRKMFGYDLEKTMTKFPIKELEDNYDRTRLISSLEKGNLHKATIIVDGKDQPVTVSANPRDNTINFYDSNMQRLEVKQVQAQKQELGKNLASGEAGTTRQETQKENQKQEAKEDQQQNKAEKKKHQMKV